MEMDAWQAFIERDAVIAKNLLAGYTCNKCQYRAEIMSEIDKDVILTFMCGKMIATPKKFPDENTCETFNNSMSGHFTIYGWNTGNQRVNIVDD